MQTAIFNGHYDLAARLIDKGADVNDGSLYTAIEMRNLATYSNRPNPPDTDTQLSSLDLVKLLLERGADPNGAYGRGFRRGRHKATSPCRPAPRHCTGRRSRWICRRCVCSSTKGADPSVAITDNSTPLMVASGLGARRAAVKRTSSKRRAGPTRST